MMKFLAKLLGLVLLGVGGYAAWWVRGHPESWAAVVAVGACALGSVGVLIGAMWTLYAVRYGAQSANEGRASDAKALQHAAGIARDMFKAVGVPGSASLPRQDGRGLPPDPGRPLPGQYEVWYPQLEEFRPPAQLSAGDVEQE